MSHSFRTLSRVVSAVLLGIALLGASSVSLGGNAYAATNTKDSKRFDVEQRIKTLHKELGITAAQESLWNSVAEVMRQNAEAMEKLRAEKPANASAIEELKSYEAAIDAHDEGLHKFIAAFQALYDSMSDAQKKSADAVLRRRVQKAAQRHKG